MPILRIPDPLRAYTAGQGEIKLRGHTVAQALDDLAEQHPALQPHLFDEQGALRSFISLFVGEESWNDLQGLETPLQEDDRLLLIFNIVGG